VCVPPRSVRPFSQAQIPALSTHRLRAYRTRLLSLDDSAVRSDWDATELSALDQGFVRFKDDPVWSTLYGTVIAVLSEREHRAAHS
jgi:hypothetical protein